MKKLLLLLLATAPLYAQAQFHTVTTKTIEKIVDRIDRNSTLKSSKHSTGDTTIVCLKQGDSIHKIIETIKTDSLFIHRDYYYNDGHLVFILESKRQSNSGTLAQVLFSKSYYENGKRIYNTKTTHNSTTNANLSPTSLLLDIAESLYKREMQ